MSKGSYLPNIEPLLQIGIDPKTGLPLKFGGTPETLCNDLRKVVRIIDQQDACNKYVWSGLPSGLTSQMVERMLYYRGSLCMFYMETTDEFYILPYAMVGQPDCYGRYTEVMPMVISAGNQKERALVEGLTRKVQHEVMMLDDFDEKKAKNACVLLYDYTPQWSQTIIPRANLNDPICGLEAEMMPMLRTSLINNCGVTGVRVPPDGEAGQSIMDANKIIEGAAKSGYAYIPIAGTLDFQQLDHGSIRNSQDFLLAMQSIDNLRLSTHGIYNGGLFEKKAQVNDTEMGLNSSVDNMVFNDGLLQRQRFCTICNSCWGINIWCDAPVTQMTDPFYGQAAATTQEVAENVGSNIDQSVQHEDVQ